MNKIKIKPLSESGLARCKDSQDGGYQNPANPKIMKILMQTKSAEILNSISEML